MKCGRLTGRQWYGINNINNVVQVDHVEGLGLASHGEDNKGKHPVVCFARLTIMKVTPRVA